MYHHFDEFLQLHRESVLRVARRVLVLIRLRIRNDKFVVSRENQMRR